MSKITLSIAAAALVAASVAEAQVPRAKSEASIGGQSVSVEYGRPSLKGRDMLGMAPHGTIWRTGADTSTTFTSAGELSSGGKTIPAGSYSLFTKRVDDKTWHLIFNKQTGQWGTEHDAGQDAVEVPLEWSQAGSSVEEFTIEVGASGLEMTWGTHVLALPLSAK